MQLRVTFQQDIVFEWILYNKFDIIKSIGKGDLYLAVWKDGPYDLTEKKVILKYSHCSPINVTNEFLDEVRSRFVHKLDEWFFDIMTVISFIISRLENIQLKIMVVKF